MNYLKNDNYGSDMDLRNEILDEIRNDLSQMKPEIVASIIDEVVHKMESRTANQLGQMQKRLVKRISELEERISALERRTNDAQKAPVQHRTPTGSPGTSKRINTYMLIGAFRFDGWIYYANKDMGDFLYRVREDGSENTQLTDYSVKYVDKVEGGYLYYKDANYNERKFKLN